MRLMCLVLKMLCMPKLQEGDKSKMTVHQAWHSFEVSKYCECHAEAVRGVRELAKSVDPS